MKDPFGRLVRDYKNNGYGTIDRLEKKLALLLTPAFEHLRPEQVTTDRSDSYIEDRKAPSKSSPQVLLHIVTCNE